MDRRRDWHETRERILDATVAVFEKSGPAGITMSAIADASDTHRATVHRHFASRDALLWAVTSRMMQNVGIALASGDDSSRSLDDHVTAFIGHFLDSPREARRALRSLCQEVPGPTGINLLDHEVALMRLLAAGPLGRDGIDVEVLAVINLAGMLLWSALDDAGVVDGGQERFQREVLRLLLHGAIDPATVPDLVAGGTP